MDYYLIMILFIPVILFTFYAQIKVKTTYNKYSKVLSQRRITGAEAAKALLHKEGIYDVEIHSIPGNLTDHYDPRDNSLNLSHSVYAGTSVADIGIACHEVGHAIQHTRGYVPIKIRAAIIPITNFGAKFSSFFIMIGLMLSYFLSAEALWIAQIGVALFSFSTLFQLVTLPTEFNASRRALEGIKSAGLLEHDEVKKSRKVLSAAAMTYVAALAMSLLELLRLISIVRRHED